VANLSASVLTQSTASNEANTAIFNASIQQMAANEAQRNADHTRMMQQFALMQTGSNTAPAPRPQINTIRNAVPPAIPILGQTQQWAPQGYQSGGRGSSNRSRRGGRRNPPRRSNVPPAVGTNIIPYIPGGANHGITRTRNPQFSNIVKDFANQNVCFSCGFDVEDWHNSSTCNNRKEGHQTGFTRSNWQEYERANHQFCRRAMHKTMYPSN
jgi:hypothetical protein